jgi:hypothetical protein
MPAFLRYWRLFIDLPADDPNHLVAGEDFEARLKAITGMTVRRYLALCFGLYTRWMTWTMEKKPRWVVDHAYWANTTVLQDEFLAAVGSPGNSRPVRGGVRR